jgi:hypothetical protein
MHVAHLEAGALAGQAARPERREATLVGDSDSGLVWSMNCESCEEPKNSRTAAAAGLALIRSCGMTVSISTDAHALADRALHAQQADAVLVLHQLADRAHAAVAEMVDVVDLAAAVLEAVQDASPPPGCPRAQRALGVGHALEVEAPFIFTRPTGDRS